jgi:hypothetical protein
MRFLATAVAALGVLTLWLAYDAAMSHGVSARSTTPPKVRTGAPLSATTSEKDCTDCHGDFAVNSGGGSIQILGVPAQYTPLATYPIRVHIGHLTVNPDVPSWGFELTAIRSSDYGRADSLVSLGPETQIQTSASNPARKYVSHTATGNQSGKADSTTWVFNWIAPASGAGGVSFWVSGVAGTGSGTSQSYVYNASANSAEASTDVQATTWGKIKTLYR